MVIQVVRRSRNQRGTFLVFPVTVTPICAQLVNAIYRVRARTGSEALKIAARKGITCRGWAVELVDVRRVITVSN